MPTTMVLINGAFADTSRKGTHLPRTAAEHQELDLEAWKTWEAGDDSGLAEAGTAWARHLRRKLRKATTELRWGMVDFDRSE
jgi:hypothetical protein